jgi:hypothetical protein
MNFKIFKHIILFSIIIRENRLLVSAHLSSQYQKTAQLLVSVRLSGPIPIIDFLYRLLKWADTKNQLDY